MDVFGKKDIAHYERSLISNFWELILPKKGCRIHPSNYPTHELVYPIPLLGLPAKRQRRSAVSLPALVWTNPVEVSRLCADVARRKETT